MDTNKFFSFSRIAMVMKREIMENWKTNLYRLIGIYAAFALVMVLTMSKQVTYSDSQMAFQHYCSNIMGTFAFIIGIFGIVYAANIMENMITKLKEAGHVLSDEQQVQAVIKSLLASWEHMKVNLTHNENIVIFNDVAKHLELEDERLEA